MVEKTLPRSNAKASDLMDVRFLLDTNICIYIRQRRPPGVLARFQRLRPGEAAISVITYGELAYGVEKSRFREQATKQRDSPLVLRPNLRCAHCARITQRAHSSKFAMSNVLDRNDIASIAHRNQF